MESTASDLKRTPLYEEHKALQGKIVPFAGWELPVQYAGGLIAEHQAVRSKAGLFDVSHMGEIVVEGPEAFKALQFLTCNDMSRMYDGRCLYNALTNETGGLVDDIIVYRKAENSFFLCVNASNIEKDFAWLRIHAGQKFNCRVENRSAAFGQLAIQGPLAREIAAATIDRSLLNLNSFHFVELPWRGIPLMAAATGYTGEDGFEIFIPWAETPKLWAALLNNGAQGALQPIGLGARDTLRLEACLSLYGHELGDDISAIESGLGWIVKPEKGDFMGRRILAEQKEKGAPRSLAGFFLDEPGIARNGDLVFDGAGGAIGVVTSGTRSPTLQRSLGLALIDSKSAAPDSHLQVQVRGRMLKAHVVKKPFYKRSGL